jgi:hypothetical protein
MTTVTKEQARDLKAEALRLGRPVAVCESAGVFVLADIENQQWVGQEVGKGSHFKIQGEDK